MSVAAFLLFPRVLTGLFFGINTSPVALALADSHSPRQTDARTESIVAAADTFLAALGRSQRKAASYAFDDNAQRSNWSNLPEGMVPRGGLKLGDLTEAQRGLLDALLAELMSEKGVRNIELQLAGEDQLPSSFFMRYGTQHFYVAFLGEPSATQPWMFQFGGHHLAINITLHGSERSFSPMLTGGNPLNLRYQGEEVFVTEEETAAAQALMDSLTVDQKKAALRGEQPLGLQLGPGEYDTTVEAEGIKGSALTVAQKQLLLKLVESRLGFLNRDDSARRMATVAADIDETHFGWWGPADRAKAAYFRVTGPSLVLEYAPQSDENHAHSIYRNPKNDYGSAWVGGAN